jgi:tetratricopeptide (TPR) repeat protein
MAHQELYLPTRLFTLNLHGVRTQDAVKAIKLRLEECFRYGLRTLKCVYGSPDKFEGSILQALCDVALTDHHVWLSELPDWVSDADQRDNRTISLSIPIRMNLAATGLDETTVFKKFKADHEPDPGLRLLCEMPFQPLRKIYDWLYAARAIGRNCTGPELRAMSVQRYASGENAQGLSIADLRKAAFDWKTWKKKIKDQAPDREVMIIEPRHASTAPVDTIFYEFSNQPDIVGRLRAFDRLVEHAEYEKATIMIDIALTEEAGDFTSELFLQKGRLLLLQHDHACEPWLLRSDNQVKAAEGDLSQKRVAGLMLLMTWYGETGEPDRALHYAVEMGNVRGPEALSTMTPKRRFLNQVAAAALLRQTGRLFDSTMTIQKAIWTELLNRDGEIPQTFTISKEELLQSGINRGMISRALLFCALNSMEMGQAQTSADHLAEAEWILAPGRANDSIRAAINQAKGRIFRKQGMTREALRCYKEALRLNNTSGSPDLSLECEINSSMGVAYAVENHALADRHYQEALKLSEESSSKESPYFGKLLINIASLRLRQRRYDDAINLANQAIELLLLKAPGRHVDLVIAFLRIGVAHNESGRFSEAAEALAKAASEVQQCAHEISDEIRGEIQIQLERASNGGRVPNQPRQQQKPSGLSSRVKVVLHTNDEPDDDRMTKERQLSMIAFAHFHLMPSGQISEKTLAKTAKQTAQYEAVVARVKMEWDSGVHSRKS